MRLPAMAAKVNVKIRFKRRVWRALVQSTSAIHHVQTMKVKAAKLKTMKLNEEDFYGLDATVAAEPTWVTLGFTTVFGRTCDKPFTMILSPALTPATTTRWP